MTLQTETELAEAVASAKGPLRIKGGGTRPIGRPVVGEVLDVSGLSGITLYEPGALTLVAQAGTPMAEVEAALSKENQRLAFEPMDHRVLLGTKGEPTIGAIVAGNISGPRRLAVSACRDFLLGVRFVDGKGQVLKNGGRVMKNVTGYDLVKLMAGSWGTLGVLSEVSLKVLPDVEAQATLVFSDLSDEQAISAMAAAMGSPFDVTGAAHDPAKGQTYVRLEGFEGSVAYRTEALSKHLAAFGAVGVLNGAASKDVWTAVRDVTGFAGQAGDVWKFSVKATEAAALASRLGAVAVQYDWGGGLLWALMPEGVDARARMDGINGHATLIRASEATRAAIQPFHPEPAPLAKIAADLRAKFDPRGILNPGLMT